MVTGVRSEDRVVIITQLPAAQYQQANEDNFPILKGQEASILLLTLQPEVSASRTGIQRVGAEHRHQRSRGLGRHRRER